MNTKPRTILILVGLFLAGAASGGLVALRMAPSGRDRSPAAGHFLEHTLQRMDEALGLTADQRTQVEALMRRTGDELTRLRRESRRATFQQIRTMNGQIADLLTPGQRAKFTAFQRDQFERMRRHQLEREQRVRPRRPGEPPPPPDDMPPEPAGEAPPPAPGG